MGVAVSVGSGVADGVAVGVEVTVGCGESDGKLHAMVAKSKTAKGRKRVGLWDDRILRIAKNFKGCKKRRG